MVAYVAYLGKFGGKRDGYGVSESGEYLRHQTQVVLAVGGHPQKVHGAEHSEQASNGSQSNPHEHCPPETDFLLYDCDS